MAQATIQHTSILVMERFNNSFYTLGANLDLVLNWLSYTLGARFTLLHSWCQIDSFTLLVPNWFRCQINDSTLLVPNWLRCQIDSGAKLTPVPDWCHFYWEVQWRKMWKIVFGYNFLLLSSTCVALFVDTSHIDFRMVTCNLLITLVNSCNKAKNAINWSRGDMWSNSI